MLRANTLNVDLEVHDVEHEMLKVALNTPRYLFGKDGFTGYCKVILFENVSD